MPASLKQIMSSPEPVLVAGPMVRYSKLPFRRTVRELSSKFNPNQNVVIYTPMILAKEFVRSETARISDFTTSEDDCPLIIQFGASNPRDLVKACKMVRPYCQGIGLNCGCPIPDQCREGVGAALMTNPYLVYSMVKAVKRELGSEFFVEVKMRIHPDLSSTVRFAKIIEKSGCDSICVHGRRKNDRSGNVPVSLEAIKLVQSVVKVPVIANGDFFNYKQLSEYLERTSAAGVMSARGVLSNPAVFCPQFQTCPWAAIEIMWDHIMAEGMPFQLILHHFVEMFRGRGDLRREIVKNMTTVDLIDWFDYKFDLKRRGDDQFGERVEWPVKN